MGHPSELLERIAAIVREDYPEQSGFTLLFEKTFIHESRRYQPDIIVQNPSGDFVCLVEIGYTRPEKLTLYRRELQVKDVRWYDKTGQLHGDVLEVAEVRRVTHEIDDEVVFKATPMPSLVVCQECYETATKDGDSDDDGDAGDVDEDAAVELASDGAQAWVIFTDTYFLPLVDCDQCGALCLMEEIDYLNLERDEVKKTWAQYRRQGIDRLPHNNWGLHTDPCKWSDIENVMADWPPERRFDFGHFLRFDEL